jgi:hypothetical protein
VHGSFLNSPSRPIYNIWFMKADTSLCDSSRGARASTQAVGSVCEGHISLSVSS